MITENKILSNEVIKEYGIDFDDKDCLTITKPCYINIDYDEQYNISIHKNVCYTIKNNKISVTLFKSSKMHVTVYK